MARRQRASSATLFLMELIVAVLYFSLAATLCIAIFVRAHVLSEEANDLNAAVNIASDCAEIIRSQDTLDDINKTFIKLYDESLISKNGDDTVIMIYFDETLIACDSTSAFYLTQVRISEKNGMITSEITVRDQKEKEIFSLDINHAIPITTDTSE